MARKVVETPFGGLLIDDDEWRPPRRSWPYEPTELERLATRAGLDDDEVRLLLFEEIQRRLRERGAVTWNLS